MCYHCLNVEDKGIPIIVYKYDDNNVRDIIQNFYQVCDDNNLKSRIILARGINKCKELAGVKDVNFKYYEFINAYSEQEFDSYMAEMAEMSYYDTGVVAEYGDRLLTLSTCDYEQNNGRFVVVARKISDS